MNRVKPILWTGLADIPFVTETAANYDIIINAGTGFAADGSGALVRRLARRSAVDHPHIRVHEPRRPAPDAGCPPGQGLGRRRQQGGLRVPPGPGGGGGQGVNAVSLNSPCIFGTGAGLFNTQGFIIPFFMRHVLRHGHGFKLSETANFDWVHVRDLAGVYVLLVRAILERGGTTALVTSPPGGNGIISTAVGRVLQAEMTQLCLDAAFEAGVLPRGDTPEEKTIRQTGLQELAEEAMGALVDLAERSWAGHKVMKGTVALLGWKPTRLEEAWRQDYRDVLKALEEGVSGNRLETSIGK